jgi:endonuclease/exonuclease/phosphatase family metal-dependent hydrolase
MQLWSFLSQASAFQLPFFSSNVSPPALQLRILTFNIRYATGSPFTNEKPWAERFPRVLNQIQHETRFMDGTSISPDASPSHSAASIICLQEVLHSQLIDLLNALNELQPSNKKLTDGPIWAHVGVGRDDGHTKGEYSPIFYPVAIFKLLHSETIWLSPTPEKPSKGWDAGSIRILTVAVLEHKATGQRILASTTHLDNDGTKSRKNSVVIILETLKRVQKEWAKEDTLPVFLAGDFNSFPEQEAYLGMAKSGYVYDLRDSVPESRRYGEDITFTGFQKEKWSDEQGRIDFIWLGPKDAVCKPNYEAGGKVEGDCQWIVDGYTVLSNVFDDGVYLSDHRCVVGDVKLLMARTTTRAAQ